MSTEIRSPLSRRQVVAGAVAFVDRHGLDALSMHKLGAEFGVTAMSLYKYVASKDDLLDGIVEVLWAELPTDTDPDWRVAIRRLATALRALVHRHPAAATLLTSRQTVQEPLLRVCRSQLDVMRAGGVPEGCAIAVLRAVLAYGVGYALAELSFPQRNPDSDDEVGRVRRVAGLLPPQTPDDLIRTALALCTGFDPTAQFEVALDLMIRGMDGYLTT
jgi:AcrR family transcriptional regulator